MENKVKQEIKNNSATKQDGTRINKYLSDRGFCSRREADRLLEEGRVFINGEKAAVGQKVNESDEVSVNGVQIEKKSPKKIIIAVNKPVGVVCTTKSFPGEENIVDMVGYESRLYPVGRLDKDSEGLIFLTNDGDFAKELTDASKNHEKEYEVTVNKELKEDFVKRMEKGIFLRELSKSTAPCKVKKISDKCFTVILTQGLNRQIRRMCETLGYQVKTLKRIRIMNVQLGDLKTGTYREIKGDELNRLLSRTGQRKGNR